MNNVNEECGIAQGESTDQPLLGLDSFNCSSPTTNNSNHHHTHTPCSSCGCTLSSSSNKRRSSPPTAPTVVNQEPPKKKLFLDPRETLTTPNTLPPPLLGFSTLPLPLSTHNIGGTSSPVLRRSVSDPTRPPVPMLSPESPPDITRPNGVANTTPVSCASLPPRPPFRRSVSDLSPSVGISRSSSSNNMSLDENPSFKALKKMKDCVEEMSLCCNELIKDAEDDNKCSEDNAINASPSQNGIVNDFVEAVRVEKTGECMSIHFTCPCGRGYQTLLNGGNCYYKLM